MTKQLFFSIVVPAHNEEGYIVETLNCLVALEYPKDSYEVIVVENGSSDKTLENARRVSGAHPNITVLSVPKAGVSAARNIGAGKVSVAADWVLFLDADTHIGSSFLVDVVKFLREHTAQDYVVGTASLWPWPHSRLMYFWYFWSNFGVYLRGSTYAGLLLVKHELLNKGVCFDETMSVGEDLRFSTQAKKSGKSFFMWTKVAQTSTRRYANGDWYKFPMWVGVWFFAMIVPIHVQRRFKYKVVR
jgi:glycosyltransferase involved in cell wall biosynthesis